MHNDDGSLTVPLWFVRIVTGVVVLAIPWASWVTIQLAQIGVRIESQSELRERVDLLEKRFTEHLVDPDIHAGGLSRLDARLSNIDRRVVSLEQRK